NGAPSATTVTLKGNAGLDQFNFANGVTLKGSIDGGADVDTLDYSTWTTGATVDLKQSSAVEQVKCGKGTDTLIGPPLTHIWDLPGANQGTLTSSFVNVPPTSLTFSGFEGLTGGALSDTFALHGSASVSGTINGGGGSDTLSYADYGAPATVDLQA